MTPTLMRASLLLSKAAACTATQLYEAACERVAKRSLRDTAAITCTISDTVTSSMTLAIRVLRRALGFVDADVGATTYTRVCPRQVTLP